MFFIKSIVYRFYSFYLSFNLKKIRIGRSVIISRGTILENDTAILDYCRIFNSKVSSFSYVSPFSILIDATVGKYTSIGPGCRIGLGVHPINGLSTSPYFYNEELFKKKNKKDFKPVAIGNDVWIGANALIMGGVRIGNGAVIGAGAVVTKDVPAYAVVVGTPAKVLKYRFTPALIKAIEQSKWWDKEHSELIARKSEFNTPANFVDEETF